jgi:hypothetical protein
LMLGNCCRLKFLLNCFSHGLSALYNPKNFGAS